MAEPIDVTSILAPTAPPDAASELRSLYAIVEELPADERLALLLRRVEGLPLQEVADLCGCSLATAKRRIASAERRLEALPGSQSRAASRETERSDVPRRRPVARASIASDGRTGRRP